MNGSTDCNLDPSPCRTDVGMMPNRELVSAGLRDCDEPQPVGLQHGVTRQLLIGRRIAEG